MRVAFFGSGTFSVPSLEAVHSLLHTGCVSALEVVTRKLKPSGRGQKQIAVPPIVDYARRHGLAWHEVEKPADFARLAPADVAIAVSYGQLIPAEYLARVSRGGLNVHPSVLPSYRGAAPLQRVIMDRQRKTGVSVQTLHPTAFDRGNVLWYSPAIDVESRETTVSLAARAAVLGAQGLSNVLRDWPHTSPAPPFEVKPSWARRISREEYKLDLTREWREVDAAGRALGKLWTQIDGVGRVNLTEFVEVNQKSADGQAGDLQQCEADGEIVIGIRVADGWIGARKVTVAGRKTELGGEFIARMGPSRVQ